MSSQSFNNDGNSLRFLSNLLLPLFLPSRRGAVYVYIHVHCKLKLKDTLNIDLIDFVLSSYFTTELETHSQMHNAVLFHHRTLTSATLLFVHVFKMSQSGII